MAEEIWKVILEEGHAGTGAGAPEVTPSGGSSQWRERNQQFRDAFEHFNKIIRPLIQPQQAGAINLQTGQVNLFKAAQQMFQQTAGGIPGAGIAMQTMGQMKQIAQNSGMSAAKGAGLVGLLMIIVEIIKKSKIFSTVMNTLITIISAFADIVLMPLMPLFVLLIRGLIALFPVFRAIGETLGFIFGVTEDGQRALKEIGNFFIELIGKIGQIIIWLISLPQKFSDFMSRKYQEFYEHLTNILESIRTFFSELPGKIAEKLKEILGGIGSFAKEKFGAAKDWAGGLLQPIFETIGKIIDFRPAPENEPKHYIDDEGFFRYGIKGSKQFGGSINTTGLYMLHAGEQVIPRANINNYRNFNFSNIFQLRGDQTVQIQKIATGIEEELRLSSIKGW